MDNALSLIVYGRVQGVGFRYFTKGKADELHLMGWVRNNPDKTVEIMATGPVSALEQFMQCIRSGPVGSWVEKVDFLWVPEVRVFKGFEIIG